MAVGTEKSDPRQLLVHLQEYGVVICKDCRFAVQPSALSNHLLRHQIYRDERRELLDNLSRLNINEPEEVPTPPSNARPIQHLPVYAGYICSAESCSHACVSHKRMCQHWSKVHGQPNSDAVDARPAKLQTFFRGNKLKYFEVTPGSQDATPISHADSEHDSTEHASSPGGHEAQSKHQAQYHTSLENSLSSDDFLSSSREHKLDMESLQYLHHFITSTVFTLPRNNESLQFWTGRLIREAFKHEFLMLGMLGTSAMHLAVINSANDTSEKHLKAAVYYQGLGLERYRTASLHPSEWNSDAIVAFGRMIGLQRCSQIMLDWVSPPITARSEDVPVNLLIEVVILIKGRSGMTLSVQDKLPSDSEFRLRGRALEVAQPLTADQLLTEGPQPFLVHFVTEYLEASIARNNVDKTCSPKLNHVIGDKDLTSLCSKAMLLSSESDITTEWVQATLPQWKPVGDSLSVVVEALRASVIPAKISYEQSLTDGTSPPFPAHSRFPHLPIEEYQHIASLPQRLRSGLSCDDAADVSRVMPEIVALLHGFDRARAYDSPAAMINGLDTVMCSSSKDFLNMIENRRAVALILYAHSCEFMKRMGSVFWFFSGQPRPMLDTIWMNLGVEAREVLSQCLSATRDGLMLRS